MTIPAVLFQALPDDDRGADRVRVILRAVQLDRRPYEGELTVLDISVSGILFETGDLLPEKSSLIVELHDGVCKTCSIVWSSGRLRGGMFSDLLSETEFQKIIAASVRRLPWPDEQIRRDAPLDHENEHECAPDYDDIIGTEKLPFGTRARIIFGSAALLWAVFGSLTWSAIAAM